MIPKGCGNNLLGAAEAPTLEVPALRAAEGAEIEIMGHPQIATGVGRGRDFQFRVFVVLIVITYTITIKYKIHRNLHACSPVLSLLKHPQRPTSLSVQESLSWWLFGRCSLSNQAVLTCESRVSPPRQHLS